MMTEVKKVVKKTMTPAKKVADKVAGTKAKQRKVKAVKKGRRSVPNGLAHIMATYNNTVVTVTDPQGDTIGWSSAGSLGFKGAKKSTPYAAGQVVHNLIDRLEAVGLREIDVFVKGIGSGREAAIRAFQARGVNVASIKDITPIPHNGSRPKKMRRV